jgi:hypothetical protein
MRETRDERTIRGAALDECREVVSMRDSQLHAAHMQLAELRATVSSQAAQLRSAGHEVQTLQSAAGFLEDRLRTAQAQEVASRTALRTLGGLEPVFEQLRGEFDCSSAAAVGEKIVQMQERAALHGQREALMLQRIADLEQGREREREQGVCKRCAGAGRGRAVSPVIARDDEGGCR